MIHLKDLLVRITIILSISLILIFITNEKKLDRHFSLRKTQGIASQIYLLSIPKHSDFKDSIDIINESEAKTVLINEKFSLPKDKIYHPYLTEKRINTDKTLFELESESDGILRNYRVTLSGKQKIPFILQDTDNKKSINFRGPQGTFPEINIFDLVNQKIDLNSILIVRLAEAPNDFITPVGVLSEAEVIANILDNHKKERFINNSSILEQLLICLFIFAISILILLYLPNTVALVATFLLTLIYLSFSFWVFDTNYYWTPIIPPLVS